MIDETKLSPFEKEALFFLGRIASCSQQTLTILERLHPRALKASRRKEIEYWNRCQGNAEPLPFDEDNE